MPTVYLAGHGSWDVKSNGFTTVPRGICVSFYTEAMKNMFTADMFSILEGKYTGDIKQFYEPGSQIPNYTLYPDPTNEPRCRQLIKARKDQNIGLLMVIPGQTSTMKKLMSIMAPGANVIWCACRYTELKDVGGKSIGVNAAQGAYGTRDAQGTIISNERKNRLSDKEQKSLYYFNPGTANRQLHQDGPSLHATLEYCMKSRRRALGYED